MWVSQDTITSGSSDPLADASAVRLVGAIDLLLFENNPRVPNSCHSRRHFSTFGSYPIPPPFNGIV
jgi:hypothetical protein